VYSNAAPGEILRNLMTAANAEATTGITLGTIYSQGQRYSLEYHYSSLADAAEALAELVGGVVEVLASESGGQVRFTLNFLERKGVDRPGVALVEGANVTAARLRDEDTIVNAFYGATDGSGWGDGDRIFASWSSVESIALHDLRQAFTVYKADDQASLQASLQAQVGVLQWPARNVALQTTNRPPGEFAEYDLGDAVTVVLPTYGFGGTRGTFKVLAREFFPDEDVCDLVVQEVVG
jgi:hypothetical protein